MHTVIFSVNLAFRDPLHYIFPPLSLHIVNTQSSVSMYSRLYCWQSLFFFSVPVMFILINTRPHTRLRLFPYSIYIYFICFDCIISCIQLLTILNTFGGTHELAKLHLIGIHLSPFCLPVVNSVQISFTCYQVHELNSNQI